MEKVSILLQLKVRKPTDPYGKVIIRGYYDRKPVTSKSTGHKILRIHWDPELRAVIKSAPNATLINTCLQSELQGIQKSLLEKQIMGAQINRAQIITAIQGYDPSRDFFAYAKLKIVEDYTSPETIKSMESQVRKLERFRSPLSFSDITYRFLCDYKQHLIDDLGNADNTVWTCMKFISTFINKAIADGSIIQKSPFEEFDRGRYIEKKKPFALPSDCMAIEKLILKRRADDILRKVAIRFLLMVYSGMRFSDAMKFKSCDHVIDGRLIMDYNKWSESVDFVLSNRLKAIIALVDEHPLQMSNQKFNVYLKAIAAACDIKINLTSHVGRHTMGYNLAEKNVPKEKAQRILGHKSIDSTTVYYHIDRDQIDREIMKFNDI